MRGGKRYSFSPKAHLNERRPLIEELKFNSNNSMQSMKINYSCEGNSRFERPRSEMQKQPGGLPNSYSSQMSQFSRDNMDVGFMPKDPLSNDSERPSSGQKSAENSV